MADLSVEICGVKFPNCLMNAAGARDESIEDLHSLGKSSAGAIVIKSATKEFRAGNPLPRYKDIGEDSVQSMGLPNLGYERYVDEIPKLKEYGKPVIAAISGLEKGDNELMVSTFDKTDVDMIEVNLSCPNIAGKGQIANDPKATLEMLTACRQLTDKPIGPKLPPYHDTHQFEEMSEVLKKSKVDFISTVNTIGQSLFIDVEKEQKVITATDGFGGYGGKHIKPIALGNVHKFHQLLGDSFPIIGVGGVVSGSDVFEHLLAGASAVSVGTILMQEEFGVFDRLAKELSEILDGKGYATPADALGKLKDLPAAA